jgi:hypothetical protein
MTTFQIHTQTTLAALRGVDPCQSRLTDFGLSTAFYSSDVATLLNLGFQRC